MVGVRSTLSLLIPLTNIDLGKVSLLISHLCELRGQADLSPSSPHYPPFVLSAPIPLSQSQHIVGALHLSTHEKQSTIFN